MVDKLGLPTIFFTHGVADLQRPELATPHLPWWPWMQFQPQQRCITVIAQVPGIYGFSKQTSSLGYALGLSLFTAINPFSAKKLL